MEVTTDKLTPERRSENMRKIKSKDMKPELLVRRLAHGLGFRYRLHRKDLPGKPDLVFGPRKKVIFVHGCFWHGHEREGCLDARRPKSNTDYWNPKLARNRERDAERIAALEADGWQILVIWECETKEVDALRDRVQHFLEYVEMRYDYSKVTEVLQRTLEWLGDERFSKMKVTELEQRIRERETDVPLPSRSQFRAAIHAFRAKRWPQTVPRRRSS